MVDIVALVASNDARARIITSVGRRAKVRLVSNPRELADAVARQRPSAVICEFGDEAGAGTAAAVRDLRMCRPTLPMIGYCWDDACASRHLLAAARAGVSALALRGIHDVGAMLEYVLLEAEGDCVSAEVSRALAGRVPALLHDALDFCIRHARELPDVAQLAEALHTPRRTLNHRLLRAGAPPPAALISWTRLFIAAELLVDEARSVDHAALALGFASGSALRGMLQRYAGVTPRQLRQRGGLTHLIALFLAELDVPAARATEWLEADEEEQQGNEKVIPLERVRDADATVGAHWAIHSPGSNADSQIGMVDPASRDDDDDAAAE